MDVQKKFWKDYVQVKFETYYLDEYVSHSHKWDTVIIMWTAISSSGSIAAWALWDKLKIVWGVIIAVSQVVTAIKPYLPYSKRIKFLSPYMSEVNAICNQYDYHWLKVSDGSMNEDDINELSHSLRIELGKIYDKYLIDNHLPKKMRLQEEADKRLEEYFDQYL